MISLFCFMHLIPHCQTGTVLYDTAQIGIEVAVPQLSADFLKNARCKKDVARM
jgi:hypothetical protein